MRLRFELPYIPPSPDMPEPTYAELEGFLGSAAARTAVRRILLEATSDLTEALTDGVGHQKRDRRLPAGAKRRAATIIPTTVAVIHPRMKLETWIQPNSIRPAGKG